MREETIQLIVMCVFILGGMLIAAWCEREFYNDNAGLIKNMEASHV